MTSIATRYFDLLSAIAGCCDRLVDPCLAASIDRPRLVRLIGSLLGTSFIAASAMALVMPTIAGAGGVLASVSATLAVFWMAALIVASGRFARSIPGLFVAGSTVGLPILIAIGGGIGSPLFLLLAALTVEPLWIARTRKAAIVAGSAVAAALAVLAIAPSLFSVGPVSGLGWYWLPVLAYALSVVARVAPQKVLPRQRAGQFDILNATGALVARLTPTGEVLDISGNIREMLGVPAEILLGTGLFERIRVSDRVGFLCAVNDVRAGSQERRVPLLIRMARKDDTDAPAHSLFDMELVADINGTDDIFAILRRNDEIERLQGELAEAEDRHGAMDAARNRLLASVSHELRTPLNAIIGFSDMLLLELFGKFNDPRQKEYVTLVRDSGHHLLEVVNSILDVSKLESGAYSIVPEAFLLREAVEMCRSMMDGHAKAKSITVDVAIDDEIQEIVADRRAVQQMLINLMSNAIKFTPAGGLVSIRANRTRAMIKLSVVDNGIGIAEHDLARLGEPFTQIHNDYTRQFDGAGLGLSLVKGLVSLHQGSMSIESAPGRGTTATVTLPIDGPAGKLESAGKLISFGQGAREGTDGGFRKTA